MPRKSHERSPVARETHELEEVGATGGSSKTPLILLAETWVVCAIALVVILILVFIAYRLSS